MIPFNPNSPQHISLLLFGGNIKIPQIEPCYKPIYGELVGYTNEVEIIKKGIKKGQIKTHKVLKNIFIKGVGLNTINEWKVKKEGIFSTKDAILTEIFESIVPINTTSINIEQFNDGKIICEIILRIRFLQKQIQTYFDNMEPLIFDDGFVHPSFQHVSTDTARLSCNNPNIQNQPVGESLVLQHFVSRYTKGFIISADQKGLEVRIEALLSGDENYIKDIINGIDVHNKNLALQLHLSYDEVSKRIEAGELKNERKKIKPFTFVMQYGGGVRAVSKKSGLSTNEVIELLKARKKEYPRLFLYYDYLDRVVNKQSWYKDPWGRRYYFKKYSSPDWLKKKGVLENYSPTEIRNYRTQGFATGTLMPILIGRFWRFKALYNRNKYLLINTIHDSIMLDCKFNHLETAKKDLLILKECEIISKEVFNYNFKVPLELEISWGKSWYDC